MQRVFLCNIYILTAFLIPNSPFLIIVPSHPDKYTMFNKGSKFYSVMHNKCPRCNEGDFFKTSNPYDFKLFDKMEPQCPVCGQLYEPEVGYYYGAMYMSYAINVFLFVAVWAAYSIFLPDASVGWTIGTIAVLSLILFPIIFRVSRLLWINLFVRYNSKFAKK